MPSPTLKILATLCVAGRGGGVQSDETVVPQSCQGIGDAGREGERE
jgi:hypothetical protein